MWCKVCTSFEPSYKNNIAVEIQFAVRYFRPNESVFAKFVSTSISPTLYGLLYSVVMFLQQRTKDTGTKNPIDQGVDMYIHDDDVVVVDVVVEDDVVVDALELLQRWSPAGQLKSVLLIISSCLN